MSKTKIGVTLAVVAVAGVAASFIPLPLHVTAPFLIEPADVRNVYVQTPGELKTVHVKPGDRVESGDLLAVLTNAELEDELRRLEAERATEVERRDAFEGSGDEARVLLAEQQIESFDKLIVETQRRLDELQIVAPVAGVIVAPPEQGGANGGKGERSLSRWSGSPLEPENIGAYLEPGTQLLAIAPTESKGKIEATLLVDQADRNDVFEDQEVELRFEHIPDKIYHSKVSEFAHRHVEYAPPPLSNKYGGALATVSEADGRERLSSNAYQARVLLDSDPELMRPGLRGTARLDAANRSLGQWIWRWISQTFYFRL